MFALKKPCQDPEIHMVVRLIENQTFDRKFLFVFLEQDILLFCWAYDQEERPSFSKLVELLEKLPKRNRRLSHPVHFWKSAEYVK